MAFEAPASFNLATAGYFESFHRRAVALHLGHVILLYLVFAPALLWREQHRHAPPFQSGFDIDFGDVLELGDNAAEHLPP